MYIYPCIHEHGFVYVEQHRTKVAPRKMGRGSLMKSVHSAPGAFFRVHISQEPEHSRALCFYILRHVGFRSLFLQIREKSSTNAFLVRLDLERIRPVHIFKAVGHVLSVVNSLCT